MSQPITDDQACNDILHWLDIHSVTLSQGVPAQLLHKNWMATGREPGPLGSALQRLFAEGWLSLTPDVDPPHLRFTVEGFRRLLEAHTPAAAAAPAQSQSQTQAPAPVRTAQAAQDAQAAVVSEITSRRRAIEPPSATEPAAAPVAPAVAPAVALAPPHASELRLRNDMLAIYRDLRLKATGRLISTTLSRYWSEMGQRADELRVAIDVVLRDELVIPKLIGMDRYWELTETGEEIAKYPATPDALLRLAPPLAALKPAPPHDDLQRLVAKALAAQQTPVVRFEALRRGWPQAASGLDDNALVFGLDLLWKQGLLSLSDDTEAAITLTESGRAYARQSKPLLSKLLGGLNRALS